MFFKEIGVADFEFSALPGERPIPVSLVAYELISGRVWRLWQDDLLRLKEPPYPVDDQSLFVAYLASAEMGCHLALNWQTPKRILDLYVEFRNLSNGRNAMCGHGLFGALVAHGLDSIQANEKEQNRELVMRGGPWNPTERDKILRYCESDVVALRRLLPRMLPKIDMPRALLRGAYMVAVAHMEHIGIPIDTSALDTLKLHWSGIRQQLVQRIDAEYGIYEGLTFKAQRWEHWLKLHNIPWPRLESGKLSLDDDTFKEMSRSYPEVSPIRELRYCLSQLRLTDLAIGSDGRNRCLLSPFGSKTSRNQPSTTKFIFGPAVWLRNLIQPTPGNGLVYVDYAQQKFGVAAALSRDQAMMKAYKSGDPYLEFGKQAGAIPRDATKETHPKEREQFKACALAVLYGMREKSLAFKIKRTEREARELLDLHHQIYPEFWAWSDGTLSFAELNGSIQTVFGWVIRVNPKFNDRSLRNFPMQANGAEILRLACCGAIAKGVSVCAPIHDALLVESSLELIQETARETENAMREASRVVLGGFELRTDSKHIHYPNRYSDPRGTAMWEMVWDIEHKLF